MTWEIFKEELLARFGPTHCEDFNEALSKIIQSGSFCEYQKEVEQLSNQVKGWTQKASVETFIGGLDARKADGVRMFKPRTLKEAIGFAWMKVDQIYSQLKASCQNTKSMTDMASPVTNHASSKKQMRCNREEPNDLFLTVTQTLVLATNVMDHNY